MTDTPNMLPTKCSICKEPQMESPGGDTCPNGHGGAEGIEPVRHTLESQSWEDAAHIIRAANGAYCFVCRREAWPKHLTYKHLAVCGSHAAIARQREIMNDVSETERDALRVGVDRGGEYLASIHKFDLRDLSEVELDAFAAHLLCGYSEAMGEAVKSKPPF